MWVEEDFIQRQIKQVTLALARVLGLKPDTRAIDAALDQLDRAYDDILGTPRALLDRANPSSVVLMLGRADKLKAYLWLLHQEADLRATRGEDATAASLRDRARLVAAASIPRAGR